MASSSSSLDRVHYALSEDYSRAGGMHSYIRGLGAGQEALGLRCAVAHRLTRSSTVELVDYTGFSIDGADPFSAAHSHFHFGQTALAVRGLLGRRWRGGDSTFHFHGPAYLEARAAGRGMAPVLAKRLAELLAYRQFGRFITASRAFADVLVREFPVPQQNVHVVYPSVDVERFHPGDAVSARQLLGLPEGVRIVAAVRRLERRMGIDTAIRAVMMTRDSHLVVAGTGSEGGELRRLVDELGASSRVTLLGRVSDEDLPLVYRAADVSVVPSRALEGFGMVVLESIASGTPVVAADIGGLREAMGPFAQDWCLREVSPEALSDALRQLEGSAPSSELLLSYAESRSSRAMAAEVEALIST